MRFENIEFLLLLPFALLLLYLIYKNKESYERIFKSEILKKMIVKRSSLSKRVRGVILSFSLIFAIIALSRPVIDNGEIKVKSSHIDVVAAFDISRSMFCEDIYPNRFKFAQRKFFTFLNRFKKGRVAVIGFSQRAFLVAPLTDDFESLKFLVKNMSLDYISLRGTNILAPLEVTNNLLKNSTNKALILFTDGGDSKNFKKEIEYAKKHHIKVFVYAIGTKKGGVIKTKNGVLKDRNGDIVVVRLNENIKDLAIESGGAYIKASLSNSDIDSLIKEIEKRFKAKESEEITIKNQRELFYYPLIISILLFFAAMFSLPRRSS